MELCAIQKELQNSLVTCQIMLKSEKNLLQKNKQNLKISNENSKIHENHSLSLTTQLEFLQVYL